MKKKQKILCACLTITMIITSCQKEDIMVKSDYNYVDRTVYNKEYQTKTNSSDDVLGQGTIVWSTYHNWCQTANNETGFGSPELFWIKLRLYSI